MLHALLIKDVSQLLNLLRNSCLSKMKIEVNEPLTVIFIHTLAFVLPVISAQVKVA